MSWSSVSVNCLIEQEDSNHSAGNILPDSNAAPALQAHQRELEKHMRRDSLENKLQNRPKPEDLIREGILEADENPAKS
jgi:hypothetical protein